MKKQLYYIAYKFLKFRATEGKNPLQTLEELTFKDREAVKSFLTYNHQIKFI